MLAKIKKKISNPYILAELLLRRMFSGLVKNDELYLRARYFLLSRKKLKITPPISFGEKLYWLNLHNHNLAFSMMVDKLAAKAYAASVIGEEYIIPTLGEWDSFDDINFADLPNQFVLKCTHDSGGLVICKDKVRLDVKSARNKINQSLRRNYYQWTREWPYKNVKPRIIAEQYMQDDENEDLIDYKFFCFNGRAEYCQVIANRHTDETIDFYDRDWKHQPFIGLLPTAHHAPKDYSRMLHIADTLANDIKSPFVRVDLYYIRERIYFGEITFFPYGGNGTFRPSEWNLTLGKMIDLDRKW